MKRILFFIVIAAIVSGTILSLRSERKAPIPPTLSMPDMPKEGGLSASPAPVSPDVTDSLSFVPPFDHARERVTKKPFGIRIDSATSPIQPERFSGYHTGTDFEIFPEEAGAPAPVRAICDGKIVAKRSASGYGGILAERCLYEGAPVTVIYGHLALKSIAKGVGDTLTRGETFGDLGAAGSADTDGERKHLHLGIRRGTSIDIRGYVAARSELSGWIDPCALVCPASSEETGGQVIFRSVPFTPQAPSAQWNDVVFQNGCEEASILMAAAWATGKSLPEKNGIEVAIRKLSLRAEELFGEGTVDTSAWDTVRLYREYSGSDAIVKEDVALPDIKAFLADGGIVIAPVDGRTLGNRYFTPPGPEYHMLVIVGYDPGTRSFITNDPGTKHGEGYRYDENTLFSAIRDYLTGHHEPVSDAKKTVIVILGE